jgi:hypothetical protein
VRLREERQGKKQLLDSKRAKILKLGRAPTPGPSRQYHLPAAIQAVLDDRHGNFDSAAMGEETEFGSETYYEEKGSSDRAWQEEWRSFERSLHKLIPAPKFFGSQNAIEA